MLLVASIITVVGGILVAWVWQRSRSRRQFRGLPRVGIDAGVLGIRLQASKNEFFDHGHKLLEQGYEQYKSTPYIIQTCDNERLVIPDVFIEELKNLPDSQISFKEELLERFMGEYTKLDAVRGTNVHRDIVRHQLTKKLGQTTSSPRNTNQTEETDNELEELIPQMKEEADLALRNCLRGCNSKEFVPVKASSIIFSAIGQVTSRRVIDNPIISRSSRWLETIMGFTASVAIFSMTMRRVPPALRPVAQRFLKCGRKLRADIAQVTELLSPVIEARKTGHATGTPNSRMLGKEKNYADADSKPQDFVQWLLDFASGKEAQTDAIVMKILFLIVAAMHTSAVTAIHVFYDICAQPDFMEELRAEAVQEIGAQGWSHATLLRLHKMESFLKESGRMNSAGVVSFQRLVLAPVRLSNGFVIPAGTHICAASDARSRDPALYESPTEFRPLRFYKSPLHGDAGTETDAANLFSSVAAGDSWFGAGRQACPGRWYASAQIKLVLCLLLIEYDFKYPEGQTERPKNWVKDEKTGPNMDQMIMVRLRATS